MDPEQFAALIAVFKEQQKELITQVSAHFQFQAQAIANANAAANMVRDGASLTLVLPISNATNVQELLETLNSFGHCVTFNDALENPDQKRRIVVGNIIREFDIFKDTFENYKKVYHLKSVVPGDASRFRFVASGKRMVDLVADNFAVTIGDHLALYEPKVMRSAADLTTFYFPKTKAILWVCKAFRELPA